MTDIVPLNVSTYVYSGISTGIQRLMNLNGTISPEYVRKECDALTEALEWYKKHCVVSYTFLKDDFDKLMKILIEKDVI